MENLTLGAVTRTLVDRMEHVHVSVADVARSIEFYRRVFGFEVRWDEDGPSGRCVHIGTDRFYIALTEVPGVAPSERPEHATIYHVGLTTTDMAAFRAHLREIGLTLADDEVYHRNEGDAVYLYDPDGHEIEVVEYRTGYVYR